VFLGLCVCARATDLTVQTKGLSLEEIAGEYGDEVVVKFTPQSKTGEALNQGKQEHSIHDEAGLERVTANSADSA